MELKALAGGLFMSLLVLWNVCDCVQTHQDANHPRGGETVINLLEALNFTRSTRGVSKVKGRDPETLAWRLRSSTPHLKLPQIFLDYLFNTSQGVLGLHLVGRQSRVSEATLISVTSSAFLENGEPPLLELVSNTKADWLQLEFRSADSLRPEVLKVPGGSPFTGGGWVRMAVSMEPRQIVLYVDCQDAVVLKLKEGGRILTLDFPQDLQVIFSSTAGKKASKFGGGWQTAELSTRAYERRPWFCDNVTDSLPDRVIATVPAIYDLDMMQDQGDRGDGIVSATGYPVESNVRLGQLENNLHHIRTMLDMLKRQISVLAGLAPRDVRWSLRVSEIAVDNFWAFLGGNAVGVVFHQASGTLASRHTGFEAVSLDHAECPAGLVEHNAHCIAPEKCPKIIHGNL